MSLTRYRRTTQIAFIAFIFLMPVFNILRYDTATRELFIFGQVWGIGLKEGIYAEHGLGASGYVAIRFFLKAILPWLLVLSVFPLLGFLTGRLFCGWLCPEGALFEYADWLTLKILGRRSLFSRRQNDPDTDGKHKMLYTALAAASALAIPVLGGIALTGYFIAPKTIWSQLMQGQPSFGVKAGIIGVSLYMIITSVLVRHGLCRFICAAGLMQMLFGWVSPVSLRVKMDDRRADECTNCRKCEKACFMNVLPRMNRRDISCVNCGACIAACRKELGEGKGLFNFVAGSRRADCTVPGKGREAAGPRGIPESAGR